MKKDLLLVIDMQNVYGKDGAWECFQCEQKAEKIKLLLDSKIDMNVIFTQFVANEHPYGVWETYNQENESINKDEYANAIMDIFQEDIQTYPVYTKSTYSSLPIQEVKAALQQAKRVVVTGVVAECCVLSTVMSLIDEGMKVIYLTDAVAGIDENTEKAVELILSGLQPLHVEMMSVQDYIHISQ